MDVRIAFACKERWEDMAGDDRVRACAACDRQVFNLSEMTRAEAEALLATRGVTPCVRFYRRPDGTVMTADCPTGDRARRGGRRLAVVASSLATGATLALAPAAMADPAPAPSEPTVEAPAPVIVRSVERDVVMGIPSRRTFDSVMRVEMGTALITVQEPRPAIEWSVWGRLGLGLASPEPEASTRRETMPRPAPEIAPASTWEAAVDADVSFRVSRDGHLRIGAWGELRTTSDPVGGTELVLEGLAPHPRDYRLHGAGSLVVRAGAGSHVVTGALGFGYVGSWSRTHPWFPSVRHMVGARVVLSVQRAIEDPHAWSTTIGLEVEPSGVVRALRRLVK
jgi:hypothetical protein